MSRDTAMRSFAAGLEDFLESRSIALTMGGEPTFLPAKPEGDEWNNAAMGPEKLGYARRFARRLIETTYPGAAVMQVFGKWYPGEPLPRWNVVLLHDRGGQPLWPETERLLLDDVEGVNKLGIARKLMERIAAHLGLEDRFFPGAEQDTKDGVKPSGWILPLEHDDAGGWVTDDWPYAMDRPMPLFAGDSPLGLRLPLGDLAKGALKRALTVEVRNGAIEIFVPPLDSEGFRILVDFLHGMILGLDLRDTVFCGYAPAVEEGDGLERIALAADPGVLEVNLPPCATWEAYDRILARSAEAAASVGLYLTKLQLNGAVHGTGGGAHLAFGGPSEARNPFLVAPSRIGRLLRYWQHHPALSYLFSGPYVGPGSQAPRVDEGPRHGLYELEVACEGLEHMPAPVEGEVIDQFFKNLLTDSAGNTHRAELCFDKFHNLAAPNGLLGIIELRAFETYATAADMSAVALFIRTVLARLFKKSFGRRLRRFGPDLHDRYFLPSFLWEDAQAICADLAAHGFAFDPAWLRPVFDFRFPELGRLEVPGGSVQLRQALESWPLMAEESRGSATVRVVDNSSDRIELTLSDPGLLETGALMANGIEVPFKAVDGRMICGVRYKCASAYPALHPHVPIQSPLSLEWFDRRSGQVVSGARYYYWNPDGPVYEGRPADPESARDRRLKRWQAVDDCIGRDALPKRPKRSPEYHYTLDLRRQLTV